MSAGADKEARRRSGKLGSKAKVITDDARGVYCNIFKIRLHIRNNLISELGVKDIVLAINGG